MLFKSGTQPIKHSAAPHAKAWVPNRARYRGLTAACQAGGTQVKS